MPWNGQHRANNGLLHRGTHCHELKTFKVAVSAATGTLEWLLDAQASGANTIGDVDNACKFLQFPEQLL